MRAKKSNRKKNLKLGGIQAVEFDLSQASVEEFEAGLEEYEALIKSAPDHSLYLLFNLNGAAYEHRLIQRFKAAQPQAESKIVRSAAYGLAPMFRVAAQGYFALSRLMGHGVERRFKVCASREEGLEWLEKG